MKATAATKKWTRTKADKAVVANGCYFDEAAANKVRLFFKEILRHSKGTDFAGKPFDLLEWQWANFIGPLFGWKRKDGTRRYRRASVWVSKKNGKSTLCSGLLLYGLVADSEPGAEVYGAAADRGQAGIIFHEAASMVYQSPILKAQLQVIESTKRIVFPKTRSFYTVLSKDARKSGHGVNGHLMIIDELHVVNQELYDTLRYAGAARRQPLFVEISTAGNDKESLGYDRYLYAKSVFEGRTDDPDLLAYIAEADSNDVWDDEKQWHKANPSLEETISLDSFRADFKEASQGSAATRANFCQLRLNIWQDSVHAWLAMDRWDECSEKVDVEALAGRICFVGLDLASTTDTASMILLFPDEEDGSYTVLFFCWVPETACKTRERKNKTLLDNWCRQGFIEKTPGDVIDYDFIREKLKQLSEIYEIRKISVDPWNATQLATQLQADGFDVVAFRQGYASMSPAAKELEGLILSGRIHHGGNPVLRWMAGNTSVDADPAGNIKPSKKNSTEKIDGIVALCMALGVALQEDISVSVYERRGIMVLDEEPVAPGGRYEPEDDDDF